jgi:hypothetical protein
MQMKWKSGRKWMIGALLLLLALSATAEPARLATVSQPAKRKAKKTTKAAPVVSRAQMELAQQMVRNAYALGQGLELRQRVALMTRLLYTMRPEVMAAEKKQWAEELFVLAQRLPMNDAVEVDSFRNAAIATAAARLAVYDPDRALELLDSVPSPVQKLGSQADARSMAARLVFAGYMRNHGAPGAQTLLAHGRKWSAQGGFPYGASATALGKLRPNEDAAEDFFRQVLLIFERGQEGLYGVSEFASLLHQAVAMEAIFEDTAEEAGSSITSQLLKLTGSEDVELTPEQKGLVVEALNHVRISAPKAYEEARKTSPGLFAVRAERVAAVQAEIPRVDLGLQASFRELAAAMRTGRKPDELREVIARGLQLLNNRYKPGACAECASPDAQSWALVSLAAFAAPMTIATQLNGIEDPFWHGYFLAIAGQQVGQPARVADPTARSVAGKEVAEPE